VTLSPNGQYRLQGWVVSALFHGLALTVALGLMAQVKPVVPKEVFTWDVALVEPQRIQETRQAEIRPAQEPAKSTPRPAVPAPSQPHMVTPVSEQQLECLAVRAPFRRFLFYGLTSASQPA